MAAPGGAFAVDLLGAAQTVIEELINRHSFRSRPKAGGGGLMATSGARFVCERQIYR
jgi:hypothetical protein